ncbi:sugar transferase [Paenibacillus gansuensis]|uniref:Sugar transferase n=1 Tax=Paenibacillus gansuensis TaxID=306542 RepID=A0ABW5PFF0_9BACL
MKRLLDLLIAAAGLVLLSPVYAGTALLVRLRLGSPVLFRQERPGLHGRTFRLYKFRTMTDARDGDGQLLSDHLRLTGTGRFLRKYSLDELPQLMNILKGDMSFVGPRPLLVRYMDCYTERERTRHLVRPGITGLAQTAGRNCLSWNERLELDARYVESRSLRLDFRIAVRTVVQVFRSRHVIVDPRSYMSDLDTERQAMR